MNAEEQAARIKTLDAADPLAHKRDEFELPSETLYLNGNSLGPLPKSARARVQEVVDRQWGQDLIAGWNKHGWIDLPFSVGDKVAGLIGSATGQVICCDSISVNLFKLLTAALRMREDRTVVLSQKGNFPTDLYVAQGVEKLLGNERCSLLTVDESQIREALTEDLAILLLTQVDFRSGSLLDIEALTLAAHEKGILVIWDLAHSAGVIPLELDAWQVDFAVGCGYKFLNGGPGAPAFIYANRKHHDGLVQPLQGWMGHKAPFEFDECYRPAQGVAQFLCGTPNILSLAALDAALDVFDGVDIVALRHKAIQLGELFLELVDGSKALGEFELLSPRAANERGSQLAYAHPQAYAISRALNAEGVIVDFREPNVLRFGFSPLFLSFEDIRRAVERLCYVVTEGIFEAEVHQERKKVT